MLAAACPPASESTPRGSWATSLIRRGGPSRSRAPQRPAGDGTGWTRAPVRPEPRRPTRRAQTTNAPEPISRSVSSRGPSSSPVQPTTMLTSQTASAGFGDCATTTCPRRSVTHQRAVNLLVVTWLSASSTHAASHEHRQSSPGSASAAREWTGRPTRLNENISRDGRMLGYRGHTACGRHVFPYGGLVPHAS